VRTIVEQEQLLETVTRRLADALHVSRVAVLLGREGGFAVAHAHGFGADAPSVRFAGDGPTAARLRETRDALRVHLDDPQSWTNRDAGSEAERPALLELQSELLLPLAMKDALLGFLSLGPKQSEQPYSPSDLRLLRNVASQTAFALENSRLTARVAAEVARAARMSREIEIAREVQEQLFPQNYPNIPGLDIAGRCRPAAGVGGDYYDFLALKNGGLGVAIGDISGKGIPAALLMAGLQASLRGQTLAGASDLAALMDNVNLLIVDASPANRYATFFYGQYDPQARRLAYVNAGHNAPMLFRGGQLIRLTDGGPVVGLLPAAAFTESHVVLERGDLLVGFTDGISECMNKDDEEWGEERLIEAIRGCDGLPALGMIDRLMAAADAFANGAKQHDDMTLVVVRVLEA
jgi:sigma-B regulation protein RsbU (phosphoserine phosphatase)